MESSPGRQEIEHIQKDGQGQQWLHSEQNRRNQEYSESSTESDSSSYSD